MQVYVFFMYISFFHVFFVCTGPCSPASTFTIRSQALNGAKRVSGDVVRENNFFYFPEQKSFFTYDELLLGKFPAHILYPNTIKSLVSTAISYQETFKSDTLIRSLFGNYLRRGSNTIKIQGSHVPDRDSRAWLADYFYLSETFDGALSFSPSISTIILDINAYFNLDMIFDGLSARIYIPFLYTQWNLGVREKINSNSGIIDGGRFSPDIIENDNLFTHALSFFSGYTPPVFSQEGVIGADTQALYTIHRQPLMTHNMGCHKGSSHDKKKRAGLGEIRYQIEYDVVRSRDYHIGFSFLGAIPANHKKKDDFIFSPQIGNNGHAEFGAGVSSHLVLWDNKNRDTTIGLYVDALATHICKAKERRTFDLKNKPLSRYMLAAKHIPLIPPGGPNKLSGSGDSFDLDFDCMKENDAAFLFTQDNNIVPVNYQFANEFSPVANLTTQDVMVSVAAQLDATLWINYSIKNMSIDFGYNFWIKAKDKIDICSINNSKLHTERNSWALHGDGDLFGYFDKSTIVAETQFSDPLVSSKAIAIAASQSAATLHNGAPNSNQTTANSNSDNSQFAFAQTVPPSQGDSSDIPLVSFEHKEATFQGMETVTLLPTKSIKLSLDPIFLKETDIDIKQTQKTLSHSFFGSVSCNVKEGEWLSSYLCFGGEIELGSKQRFTSALSQWSMWAKVGLIFN